MAERTLTLQERVARLERRRRISRVQAAVESAAWFAGSGVMVLLALGAMLGLR